MKKKTDEKKSGELRIKLAADKARMDNFLLLDDASCLYLLFILHLRRAILITKSGRRQKVSFAMGGSRALVPNERTQSVQFN